MYKTFILLLFILTIIYISASIAKHIGEKNTKYAEEEIIYKYGPEPLAENQLMVSEILASMFYKPPKLLYRDDNEKINK
jgi:hypothetical protein